MSAEALLWAAVFLSFFFLGQWLGYRAGKRAGLRAPLSERMRAARADLSRSDAALGELPPRVRSSDQSRSQRRLRSW